ncbi:MAG: helix-turn-helix domain-containing protein [Bacteroidetes bacterium]|nr:helix-turn-helix domain-containing protein [Bacteroidota bacterium]
MSSNMQLQLACEYCKKEFTARKTTTRFCSHNCARNTHKDRTRNAKIQAALERKNQIKQPKEQRQAITAIQQKDLLNLDEAAALLHISPLTCRRWLKEGKITSSRIGKKHIFKREYLNELINQKSKQINK